MTQREKKMVGAVLLSMVGVGGLAIGVDKTVLKPLREYDMQIDRLSSELAVENDKRKKENEEFENIVRLRGRSLPTSQAEAVVEYEQYLHGLLVKSGFTEVAITTPRLEAKTVGSQAKKANQTILKFAVQAKGDMANVAKALEGIQRTPLLHRVSKMTLTRVDNATKGSASPRVTLIADVEALILNHFTGIDARLIRGDILLGLTGSPLRLYGLAWAVGNGPLRYSEPKLDRQYADIDTKNVFVGYVPPPPPEPIVRKPPEPKAPPADTTILEHIRLTGTTPTAKEATLRNRLVSVGTPEIRLRAAPMSGYDFFRIKDDNDQIVLRARVVRVDQRDVYIEVEKDMYAIHVGQTLAEAMKKPLSTKEVETLELRK